MVVDIDTKNLVSQEDLGKVEKLSRLDKCCDYYVTKLVYVDGSCEYRVSYLDNAIGKELSFDDIYAVLDFIAYH